MRKAITPALRRSPLIRDFEYQLTTVNSSVPTSPFADACSDTYIEEDNESQDYEADNEKEQDRDISMGEPQILAVEGQEDLDW